MSNVNGICELPSPMSPAKTFRLRQISEIVERTRYNPSGLEREIYLRGLAKQFAAEGCISSAEKAANEIPRDFARALAFRDISNVLKAAGNPSEALKAAKKIPDAPIRETQFAHMAKEWGEAGDFNSACEAVDAMSEEFSRESVLRAIDLIGKQNLRGNSSV